MHHDKLQDVELDLIHLREELFFLENAIKFVVLAHDLQQLEHELFISTALLSGIRFRILDEVEAEVLKLGGIYKFLVTRETRLFEERLEIEIFFELQLLTLKISFDDTTNGEGNTSKCIRS